MQKLKVSEAKNEVRRNLDELNVNLSNMFPTGYADVTSLDDVIEKTIPDAINAVNMAAPVQLLEGVEPRASYEVTESETATYKSDYKTMSTEKGVLSFKLKDDSILRMVAFKVVDSDIVVTGLVPEASAEGHMQLNRFTRGTYDDPRLVRVQGYASDFRYYSLKADTYAEDEEFNLDDWLDDGAEADEFPVSLCEYIPLCYADTSCVLYHNIPDTGTVTDHYYDVSTSLKTTVVRQLTGMVLKIYGEFDKASAFLNVNNDK